MEIIYILLLLLIIYFQVSGRNNLAEKMDLLEKEVQGLKQLLRQTRQADAPARPAAAPVEKPVIFEPPKPQPVTPPEPVAKPIAPQNIERKKEEIADPLATIRQPVKTRDIQQPPIYQPAEPELSFFERHPDLEKFIGENLINKIGIAILVLAIGFFVKYAIDNNWIGPIGRVGIGVLCGGILIGLAHRLRASYTAFSSVLVGGGLAVLYFTITLAYHQFHLFNQTTSFIILIVITCFAVALSLLYDKQELAVIALIGGLSSPFMVSGDVPNYHALFSYLVILNLGLLAIAYRKSWRVLNASAFGLTVIVFGAATLSLSGKTYLTGFIYASVLYLLFFAINVANNVRENKKFIASDFSILLINTGLYFAAGLYLLTAMHREEFRGLFSAGLGLINLILSYVLFKNRKVDTNILYLLIGVTLTFISLTAPIQLHGHNITLFWAAEAVLLYWLYQKSDIQLMKLTSLLIWVAMLISLGMDWLSIYTSAHSPFTIIANQGFITTIVAAISSYLLFTLMRKEEANEIYSLKVQSNLYKYVAFVLLFMSGLLEVNHQFLSRYPDTQLNGLYLMLYIPAFIFTFYMLLKKIPAIQPNWVISTALLAVCVVAYLLFNPQFFDVQYLMLVEHKVPATHLMAHWLGAVFVGLIFYQLVAITRDLLPEEMQKAATWILSAAIVLFLSLELSLLSNQLFYSPATAIDRVVTVYIKVGLPIIWGLSSFALMWLGMRYKVSTLRIISLTLFSITLVKLFVFDIQNIPPAGKIAAFFCLGVLLLIVSFMYQKVKKIIVEDETPQHD